MKDFNFRKTLGESDAESFIAIHQARAYTTAWSVPIRKLKTYTKRKCLCETGIF